MKLHHLPPQNEQVPRELSRRALKSFKGRLRGAQDIGYCFKPFCRFPARPPASNLLLSFPQPSAMRAFVALPPEAVSLYPTEAVICSFPFCGQTALTCTGRGGRDDPW